MMSAPPPRPRDPLALQLALIALFVALGAVRLAIPSHPYFDEVHYLPAARALLEGGAFLNREHPPLAKELIALAIALFGDRPLGWRIAPLLAGALTLFGAMRALWHASRSAYASCAFGLLLASGFFLFVLSRLAMLDSFATGFLALAAWQFAKALRENETANRALALCGAALGLSLAAKWSVAPIAFLPLLAFVIARLAARRRHPFTSDRGIPVAGISLRRAGLLLGALPLGVYALCYAPLLALDDNPFAQHSLLSLHREMIALHASTIEAHRYQSSWPQWVANARSLWLLFEQGDGLWRGIVLIGNPLTSLLAIPALLWCAISGWSARDWSRLAVAIGYGAALGFWVVAPKPVQFLHNYFIAHLFALGALALALDALRRHGHALIAHGTLALSLAVFAWFYPLLSAAPLEGKYDFARWMWLTGWR